MREDVPSAGFHRRLWETQNYEEWQVWWPRRKLEDLDSKIIAYLASWLWWWLCDYVKFVLG